jgi:NAD(P)-dependent dehydrogenase (short-subunit alcohol dehydrogenase family)
VRLLTKNAAVQYAKDKIRVNSVHPGRIETPMTTQLDPARREMVLSMTPLGRDGKPEEVAYGVLYLASDESSFVTGAELVIDGGFTAR